MQQQHNKGALLQLASTYVLLFLFICKLASITINNVCVLTNKLTNWLTKLPQLKYFGCRFD